MIKIRFTEPTEVEWFDSAEETDLDNPFKTQKAFYKKDEVLEGVDTWDEDFENDTVRLEIDENVHPDKADLITKPIPMNNIVVQGQSDTLNN